MTPPASSSSSLVQLITSERHSTLGIGMLARSHLLGAWVGGSRCPTFVAFCPSVMAHSGLGVVNVVMSTILRASWATSLEVA